MTKARDLANIMSGGFTAADIPNLDASKITTGELANDRVAALPTSKITSGTFADARIASSSVTQHVTATDLQPVKSDIAALALREATNESSAAFNLPNQFIDTFTDDTNLGTQTTVDRVDGYIASVYSSTSNVTGGIHGGDGQTPAVAASGSSSYTGYDGVTRSAGQIGDPGGYNSYSFANIFAADEDFEVIMHVTGNYQAMGYLYGNDMDALANIGTHETGGYTGSADAAWSGSGPSQGTHQGQYHSPVSGDGGSDYENLYRWHRSGGSFKLQYYGRSASAITVNATSIAAIRASSNYVENIGGVQTRNEKMLVLMGEAGSTGLSFKIEVANKTTSVANATGTLIQSANTVGSAKTKVGGTFLYKDLHGTATLGTDLKIYFTCNGGTNWTEASSYSAITPVYSTGIKQVRLGETTCTSGTDIRYKAVWANQASGSKETQLHGIGINY